MPAEPASEQTVLVSAGSDWKYLDDGSNQGIPWREVGFDDSAWNSGPAQLGYGDGDEATVVGHGPNPNNKYVTTYFRHSFEVADPSQFSSLQLRLLRDDGAVVYLNGTEIQRSNMPAGSINFLTFASSAVGGGDEDTFFEYNVDSANLIPGTNVLAVELHQSSGSSSDISFDIEAVGVAEIAHPVRKAPYLIYTGDNTEMTAFWQLVCTDTCRIQWGFDTLYSLGNEETFEYGDDHQHEYTFTDLTPSTTYFYRVIAEDDTAPGSFRSAPPSDATQVGFLAYGDTRTYPNDHDQVAGAMISAYTATPGLKSLLVCVGDLVSDGDDEGDWDSEFFDPSFTNIQTVLADLPYQTARGNHEGSGAVFSKYFPYPFESPHYWSFDYGPAHFVVIDQYVDYSPGSAQHTWIDNDLSETTKRWRLLVLHEPGWSAGGGHGNNTYVQNYLQPLCVEHGVSIVFAGHNHYYARADVDGVQHVTTGGGGAPLHTPNLGYPNIVTAEKAYHYCAIEIEGGFLDFVAISAGGDTLDQFTLTDPLTGVEDIVRGKLDLGRIVPNPFTRTMTIAFTLAEPADVTVEVYDATGRRVVTLMNDHLGAGDHFVEWAGCGKDDEKVPSGVYFYRVTAGDEEISEKAVFLQ